MIIYSHRGYKKKENTIESFINSFSNFDGIEMDVRLTKDNIPVIIHDRNLLRTHNKNIFINLTNFKELKKYNIPSLIEVLTLIKQNNKKCLIDIKEINDTNFILNFIKNLVKNKKYNSSMIKCIVYKNDISLYSEFEILRAYEKIISKNIKNNINKFYGVSLKFDGSKENINSIKEFLGKIYINLYIMQIPNKFSYNFIKNILYNYSNKVSLTLD
jgi:glycerophosphoryl diester phosphodiesterase